MKTKYLLKLTPHDTFFFGGENTFGEDNLVHYFVKSNYFPQQTGVLGFVRYQLLAQCQDENTFKNNRIQNKELASELIGSKSFRLNGEFDFKSIHSISPVFICDSNAEGIEDDYYFPANKEYQYNEKEKEFEFLEIALGTATELKEYDPKYGLKDLMINKNNKLLKYDQIFEEHKQVGIRKKYEGGSNDKSYHLQSFYKFKKNYCFAVIVELSDDVNVNVNFKSQSIVTFGGEQKSFRMDVSQFISKDGKKMAFEDLIPDYKKSIASEKVVLVSDAYVNEEILDVCKFAITETVDFRFIKSNTEEKSNYYKKPDKSNKYNLYKKGSVFYGNHEEIEEKLFNEQLQYLGYNIFKTIKQN